EPKPVKWVGSSRRDIRRLPKGVRLVFGQAIFDAQTGKKHPDAEPLKGFGGSGVLEVVADDRGSTYRAVYTVRFASLLYVLHVFQKKSKTGAKTPLEALEVIKRRLKEAAKDYAEHLEKWQGQEKGPR